MKGRRIILPLDGIPVEKTAHLVQVLSSVVGVFKIGLEFITKLGGQMAVDLVKGNGGQVFLDGKFCDIPNTVGEAAKAAAMLGVEFFNVHANCGAPAIKAAADNKGKSKLLVVTVLTSLSPEECQFIFGASNEEKVLQFAQMAKEAGADGLICSPKEVVLLREEADLANMLLVTPGVRPDWAAANDQKRIMTPREAIKAGSNYLVIGRPITKPPESKFSSPYEAANAIADEIEAAEKELDPRGSKEV